MGKTILMPRMSQTVLVVLFCSLSGGGFFARAAEPLLELPPQAHIAYIGNTTADRMQHHGWLETYIHALHPEHDLTIRNLGFPGDEVKLRSRADNFGTPDQWLTKTKADVVFGFFGYNEALRGEAGLDQFRRELAEMIDGMRAQKYNGTSAPELVLFSPIAHENLKSRHLPVGSENNQKLELYTRTMQEICQEKNIRFVDLLTPTLELYSRADQPLTMNGIHLLDHGNRELAKVIVEDLFGKAAPAENEQLLKLREAVLDKNYHWFSRYRVVDGYNVYGGRSKLAWFGQSNADVMMREMEIFDVKTGNRDRRVWARARGGDLELKDDNLPAELEVRTNKPGPLEGGGMPYLDGQEAISKMTVHAGMQVNLFASEAMFPRLINPVQMAVDTDSRLWAAVWPSYPHWNPTQPRRDALLIFPDNDGDGVADECIVFADELNSITGFEFWGGGVLVAAPPEIWFLKDTTGDDRADVKIRMLQGVSSADTHHSANALLIGPDGWLYWSRGIFNVANFETPTKTYRSGTSGVHRFNPRTFEVEFHFPIGPNPHGDVFDQWGYQFANDGTSGTGSYINIGKGVGNKQWFEKRVRPVAATGILSSSHFPEQFQGNFLICNTIGVLGVLQHEVKYNGADITAEEVEPILLSSDENFRPSDLEIGGDGGLYVADWHNALIGHMQHNMRDPNRDDRHGRIYRVTYKDRPLLQPARMKGRPIAEVCGHFLARENGTRYRARLELSGRDSDDMAAEVSAWASQRNINHPDDAQALLECLWVFEEHRLPNEKLLATVFQASEPRVRAAAIRTLGHWGDEIENWNQLLAAAARDNSALVRAEAVKAAVSFESLAAAEAIFEVATRPTDPELETVLKYAKSQINVDKIVQEAVDSGRPLSEAAEAYALLNAPVATLLKLKRSEAVYGAILDRSNVPAADLKESLEGLAALRNQAPPRLLVELIARKDESGATGSAGRLGELLTELPADQLKPVKNEIETLASSANSPEVRQSAYAAWIIADGSGNAALFAASRSKDQLREMIEAIPRVGDEKLRGTLYKDVRSLMFELPPNLEAEPLSGPSQAGIKVEFYAPNPPNVALETLARLQPQASGIVPEIVLNVPQKTQNDQFALKFTGFLRTDSPGRYTFWTNSDDGSRLYIGNRLVVDNDGLHGMVEKRGSIELSAGLHPMTVTYFDNGGADGLIVSWAGPGIRKQRIPADRLSVGGGESVHDVAIRSLASIPGHETEKFLDLARLIKAGRHRAAAISVLSTIPESFWSEPEIPSLVDNLVGYVSTIPASARTGEVANEAIGLTRSLSTKLPPEQRQAVEDRLQNLDVRIIAIGTVPARMIYDKERIAVQAGKPVEFRFSNSDHMPHNFAIVLPGALQEVGELAEATANTPDAKERHYIPKSDKVLLGSRLLEAGQSQALTFDAPSTPGVYPYVCTYPGHWRRMFGALYVVEDLDAYLADPEQYLAANPLPLKDELLKYTSRNTEWKFEQLIELVSPLPHGRSFEVGRNLFKVANCVACHKLNDEGHNLGPDLTKLDEKKHTTAFILESIVDPSKVIDEKYQSHVIVLESGKVVTGLVVEETPAQLKVLVDPLAKADPVVVEKSEIEERTASKTSVMPMGLLNKLTEEEILDLIAYIYARGDKRNHLFEQHHH
jgi:putative heme-binding domain-containing protein